MKRIIFPLVLLLVACKNETTETTKHSAKHKKANKIETIDTLSKPTKTINNSTIRYKYVLGSVMNQDMYKRVKIDTTNYDVQINIHAKNKYTIRDTSERRIFLYPENSIEIAINGKKCIIDKKKIKSLYDNKNTWYHSNFGNCEIVKVDQKNKAIVFSSFFGYNQSDFGEVIQFSVDTEGNYKFIDIRSLEVE